MRFKIVWNYHPPVKHSFFTRYGNGITLWVGRVALHIWRPAPTGDS